MNQFFIRVVLLALALLCGGCANVPAILEAAAHDPASVHVEINTLYGRVVYDRNMSHVKVTAVVTP